MVVSDFAYARIRQGLRQMRRALAEMAPDPSGAE
jgi:hypothetical protein